MFEEAQAEQLAGRDPRAVWLIKMDFASAAERVWLDHGELQAGGHVWKGVGQIVDLDGLEQAVNGEAAEVTITLSAITAAMMTLARDDFEAEAYGRAIIFYLQFLHAEHDTALGTPYPLLTARMQRPRFTLGEDGTRQIIITSENANALRSRPAYGTYSDADQQARYPGDKGFAFVSTLRNKKTIWPDY